MVPPHGAKDPGCERRFHADNGVAERLEAHAMQDGRVDENVPGRGRPSPDLGDHHGMHDGLQPRQGRRVRKNDFPERLPVDAPPGPRTAGPKASTTAAALVTSASCPRASTLITVKPLAAKDPGNDVLPRAVASGQANDHGRSPSPSQWNAPQLEPDSHCTFRGIP